jgi:DNA-directed RNA polymerase subunit RPC12/RpoP
MEYVDGNAMAGTLRELFGVEMTVARGVCAECGSMGEVASLHVYTHAPGTVVRCPTCGSVLMRLVRARDRMWLDMSGLRTIEVPSS